MLFKKIAVFQLAPSFAPSPIDLEEKLASRALQKVNKSQASTVGAMPVHEGRYLIHEQGYSLWHLGTESWILPSSVVNEFVDEQCKEFEKRNGFPAGRKVKRDMKDEALMTLRAKSFTRKKFTRCVIDHGRRRLYVEASSWNSADEPVSFLRELLESLPALGLMPVKRLSETLTGWVVEQNAPPKFSLFQSFEIRSASDGPKISYSTYAENSADVQKHLADGMKVSRVALRWGEDISFTASDSGFLKSVKNYAITEEAGADSFQAGMLIGASTMGGLVDEYIAAIGGILVPEE